MVSLRSIKESFTGKQPLTLVEFANKSVVFTADAIISEGYNRDSDVSSYPSEEGSDFGENARVVGTGINVQGLVSDATLSYFGLIEAVASSSIGQLFEATSKSQEAWNQLEKWQEQGTGLIVKARYFKDGLKELSSGATIPFQIKNFNAPRNKSTGAALRYSLQLVAIRQVTIGALSLTSLAQAVSKGSQALSSNTKSDAVDDQPAVEALRDNKTEQANVNNLFGGS